MGIANVFAWLFFAGMCLGLLWLVFAPIRYLDDELIKARGGDLMFWWFLSFAVFVWAGETDFDWWMAFAGYAGSVAILLIRGAWHGRI